MEIERAKTKIITSKHQTLLSHVPECEGELPDNPFRCLFTPTQKGLEQKFGVRGSVRYGWIKTEREGQVVPVIDSNICYKSEMITRKWTGVVFVLRKSRIEITA